MTKLTKKERKREEAKAFKLVKKLGNKLTGLDAGKVGDNAYLVGNVLKRLESEYKGRNGGVTPEEDLAYQCLQVAAHVLSRQFDPGAKAFGLLAVCSAYWKLYEGAPEDSLNMKLVKHGLRHVSENMGPLVVGRRWTRYELSD